LKYIYQNNIRNIFIRIKTYNVEWSALGLSFLIIFVAFSRLVFINADPPNWIGESYLGDGGWWAGSAKGKVLLGDYFSIDLGMSYLLLPGYTWILELIYSIWGVGIIQTRNLAAVSNILTIIIIAILVWKRVGKKESLLTTLLLWISPFFWAQSRVELPESIQCLFIVSSISFWLFDTQSKINKFLSGLLMAAAIAVKPTSLRVGFIPFLLAIIAWYFLEYHKTNNRIEEKKAYCSKLKLFFSGLTIGLFLLFVLHIMPNWNAFWAILSSEAGISGFDWSKELTIPGIGMVSKTFVKNDYQPIIWRMAIWSPAIFCGAWIYFIWFFVERNFKLREFARTYGSFETIILIWVFCGLLSIFASIPQPEYRFMPLIPGLAILCSLIPKRIGKLGKGFGAANIVKGFKNRFLSFFLWGILLIPPMLVLKPMIAKKIMSSVYLNLPLGKEPGIGMGAALSIFTAVWMIIVLILSKFQGFGNKIAFSLLKRNWVLFITLLLIFECSTILLYFTKAEDTLTIAQGVIAKYVPEGDMVFGKWSGTLFLPYKVRTSQRLYPYELQHPVNSNEILNQVKPEFIIIPKRRNFRPYKLYGDISNDLINSGYESVVKIEVGPRKSGKLKYKFDLFHRIVN